MAERVVAVVRIAMGLLLAWAFVDKTFGLGYATSSAGAWINGGSHRGIPQRNQPRAVRLDVPRLGRGCLGGLVLMLLMWAAECPLDRHADTGELTRSTNPIIDYHIAHAPVLIALAALPAGAVWGLGGRWANRDLVRRNHWLV